MEITRLEWKWIDRWLLVAELRFQGKVREPYVRAGGVRMEDCLHVLADGARCGSAIDAAVHVYAKQGRWPRLSKDDGFYLTARLAMAREAVAACISRESTPEGNPRSFQEEACIADAIWLLTGYWDDTACPLWLKTHGPGYVDLSD